MVDGLYNGVWYTAEATVSTHIITHIIPSGGWLQKSPLSRLYVQLSMVVGLCNDVWCTPYSTGFISLHTVISSGGWPQKIPLSHLYILLSMVDGLYNDVWCTPAVDNRWRHSHRPGTYRCDIKLFSEPTARKRY